MALSLAYSGGKHCLALSTYDTGVFFVVCLRMRLGIIARFEVNVGEEGGVVTELEGG